METNQAVYCNGCGQVVQKTNTGKCPLCGSSETEPMDHGHQH